MSEKNQQISGAITYPEGNNVHSVENQPRQPQNLQDLLRFAVEASETETAPEPFQIGPMDQERARFLEKALKSMTVDIINMLQKNVQMLKNADSLSVDSDPAEYMAAFENILDHVDNIDTANDFHRIGGFSIFCPCMKSVHACIRAGACNVLAELCQNNPYCQNACAEGGLMMHLLDIVDKDPDEDARVKAVYAISCNVRENDQGIVEFMRLGGVGRVLRAMQIPHDRLRTKCAFLLSCLAPMQPQIRNELIETEAVPFLAGLLAGERRSSHEHLLSLLVAIVQSDSPIVYAQCRDPRCRLEAVLKAYLSQISNRDDCLEEAEYCRLLLTTVFKEERVETDR